MEIEIENNEEPERTVTTRRRSSILKIPKTRISEDDDITETCTDISMFKPVRRVSFASSNFIKPFAADPEKNTIWDTTYEEDVNHTNSTQSSQEQILNSCSKLGSTLFDSVATGEKYSNVGHATMLCEQNMEMTNLISIADKENIPLYHQRISIVDYAKKLSSNPTGFAQIPIFNLVPPVNVTKMSNMELTCQSVNMKDDTIHQDMEMDLTDISICKSIEKSEMEFTCQIPTNMNRVLKEQVKNDTELTCQIQMTKTEEEMELTCHVPPNSTKDTNTMEFTCQIPQLSLTKTSDMEFTCQLPSNIRQAETKENLELSCQNPKGNLTQLGQDMEFTCQNFLTKGRNLTGQMSETVEKTDAMEFTCRIPPNQNLDDNLAQTNSHHVVLDITRKTTEHVDVTLGEKLGKSIIEQKNVPEVRLDTDITNAEVKNLSYSDMEVDETINKTCQNLKTNNEIMSISRDEMCVNGIKIPVETISSSVLEAKSEVNVGNCSLNKQTDEEPISHIHNNIEISMVRGKEKSYSLMEIDQTYSTNQENWNLTCHNTSKPVEDLSPSVPLMNGSNTEQLTFENKQSSFFNKTYTKPTMGNGGANCDTPQKTVPKVSQIPVRTNSSILNTPDRSSAQKTCQLQKSKLNHSPVTEDLQTKLTSSTDKLTKFKNLSYVKTPEPSFHINLTNISSGIDDTEHLLQCSYSKPCMKSAIQDDDFELNLEETGQANEPTLPGISRYNFEETMNKTSPDTSVFDIPKCKLANVNDTYFLKNKKDKNDFKEATVDDEDTSLGLLTDDCLQNLEEIQPRCQKPEEKKGPTRTLEDFQMKKYPDFRIKRLPELLQLQEKIATQAAYITNYLENFKCKPMNTPKDFIGSENSSTDNSSLSKEIEDVSIPVPTVEENIRKRQESCQKCWKLEKVDDDFYHFSSLFGTLIFVVRLHPETSEVLSVDTSSKLKVKSKPIARYMTKILLEKLRHDHIRSAIGDHCDILSLLDYVQMTMLHLHKFQCDFTLCELWSMDEDFVAKYTIISVPLILSCEILVNVSDLDHLKYDKDFTFVTDMGTINENEVRNLARNCAKGLDFFSSFHNNIQEYLLIKQKKKFGSTHQ